MIWKLWLDEKFIDQISIVNKSKPFVENLSKVNQESVNWSDSSKFTKMSQAMENQAIVKKLQAKN